jgi:chromate reductase
MGGLMQRVRILAFAASHREGSLNRRLIAHAVSQAEAAGAAVTLVEYAHFETPLMHDTDDLGALPEGVARLADALLAHDAILIASPEYNWSMPASLKNLIDWLSVDPRAPLTGKPVLLLCATPSARGGVTGLEQLRTPLALLGAWIYPQLIGIGNCAAQENAPLHLGARDQQFIQTHVAAFVHAAHQLAAPAI